jgi:hypothetical protein
MPDTGWPSELLISNNWFGWTDDVDGIVNNVFSDNFGNVEEFMSLEVD